MQNKTPLPKQERNERVAKASEPPVVIPVVVVTVDVHVTLLVPAVERGELYRVPPMPPPLENLVIILKLNRIRHRNALALCTKYLHFFVKCLHTPLYPKP